MVPSQARLIEIDTRPDTFGQIRRDIPVSPLAFVPRLDSIGNGRFLVWLGRDGDAVNLFDTFSNQVAVFRGFPAGSQIVAVDSSRLRIFLDTPGETWIIDGLAGTVRSVPASSSNRARRAVYVSSTERLFVSREPSLGSPPEYVIDVVDVAAARLEGTIPLGTGALVSGLAADPEGRRLFVANLGELQVLDAQSGALLLRLPGFRGESSLGKNALVIDESRRRLLMLLEDPPGIPRYGYGAHVAAFGLDTATLLAVVAEPALPHWSPDAQLLTGPRSPVYVFSPAIVAEDACPVARLDVIDPTSGAISRRLDVRQLWTLFGASVCRAYLVVQSPPAVPMIRSQTVTGRRVTLSWTPVSDASHYELEAGSSYGMNNLATLRVGDTSLTIDGVPSGRYFVRVRAINAVGRSLPSNEVEIVVP